IDEGRLGPDQLDWLDRQLGAGDAPSYLVLHHPPTTIGLGLMDPIRLVDGDELAAVVDHHPHVVATLVGHAHTMGATPSARRPPPRAGGAAPPTPAAAEAPPMVWYDAPPSFALHMVDDGRVTTHWRALPG